jgi:hypothetical protein
MKIKEFITNRVTFSLIIGTCATVLMQIPLVGVLFMFVMIPFTSLLSVAFPYLTQTGEHVDFSFIWIILKTPFAWFVYISYFSLLFYIITYLITKLFKKKK